MPSTDWREAVVVDRAEREREREREKGGREEGFAQICLCSVQAWLCSELLIDREREVFKKRKRNEKISGETKRCRFDKLNGIVLNNQKQNSELLKRHRFYLLKRRRFDYSRDTLGKNTSEDPNPHKQAHKNVHPAS